MTTNVLTEKSSCWMRVIELRLYSKINNSVIKYGGTDPNQLNIKITGEKVISTCKDNCTISINNLTYEEIVKIQYGEYYIAEVWVGYRTGDLYCFFSGEVAYISNKINARRDYTCYIICSSRFMASLTQQRINLNCNSSINLYAAYSELLRKSGIPEKNANISDEARKKILDMPISNFGNAKTIAEQLAGMNNYGLDINTDSSAFGKVINISTTADKRRIILNKDSIIFKNGNPTLSSAGVNISLMPTFDYMPGDIIIFDNSILDISETTLSGVQQNYKSIYFDTSYSKAEDASMRTLGAYMIRSLKYTFENRGNTFQIDVNAFALSVVENILGEK